MLKGCYRWSVLGLVFLLTAGCGEKPSTGPKLAPVTGTVTMDGEPLAGATVMSSPLPPESGDIPKMGAPSFGVTDKEGRFTLKYRGRYAGSVPGPCSIRITTASLNADGSEAEETVPERYNTNSTLKETVVDGKPNDFKFELTSKAKGHR